MRAVIAAFAVCFAALGFAASQPPAPSGSDTQTHNQTHSDRSQSHGDDEGALFGASSDQKYGNSPEQKTKDDSSNGWWSIGEGVVGIIIAGLTLAVMWRQTGIIGKQADLTAGQNKIMESQTGIMDSTLKATENAANAAKKSADVAERALIDLESPFLYPIIKRDIIDAALQTFSAYNQMPPSGMVRPHITFTIKNFGRTPALLRSVGSVFDKFSDAANILREDIYQDPILEPILEAGKETVRVFELEISTQIDRAAAQRIKSGHDAIRFYGSIIFDDIFGSEYTQTFCFIYVDQVKTFVQFDVRHNKRTRKEKTQ